MIARTPEQRIYSSFGLSGAVAIVTGAASGIGRACAELLSFAGARVVLLDRDEEAVNVAADAIGQGARARVIDISDAHAVNEAVNEAIELEGHIDVLVNNAAMAIRRSTDSLSLEDWQRVVDVNMTGTFLCSQAVGRKMLAQRSGVLVNIASTMELSGGVLFPNISYHATKGAIVNMTRALAVEWASSGIRVNAVAPTWVRTPFIAGIADQPELMEKMLEHTPLGRLATAEEVAHAVLFLASPAASMITGHTLAVDGGFLAR